MIEKMVAFVPTMKTLKDGSEANDSDEEAQAEE